MAHYHCLLIDLDGTLLDFEAAEESAISDTLSHFKFEDIDAAKAKYKEINKALWQAHERGEIKREVLTSKRFLDLLNSFNMRGDSKAMDKFYLDQLSKYAPLYDGALDMLKELAEVATLAVITNGVERVQLSHLEISNLSDLFDAVFISERVGASKPSRKIFDVALDVLGIENRNKVLVIGDSLSADIKGGQNAGLDTCYVNFAGEELPKGANPTYTITSYEQLYRIVMEEEELEHVGDTERRHQV